MTMTELLRINETNITGVAIIAISQKEVANQYVTDERTIANICKVCEKTICTKQGKLYYEENQYTMEDGEYIITAIRDLLG